MPLERVVIKFNHGFPLCGQYEMPQSSGHPFPTRSAATNITAAISSRAEMEFRKQRLAKQSFVRFHTGFYNGVSQESAKAKNRLFQVNGRNGTVFKPGRIFAGACYHTS